MRPSRLYQLLGAEHWSLHDDSFPMGIESRLSIAYFWNIFSQRGLTDFTLA